MLDRVQDELAAPDEGTDGMTNETSMRVNKASEGRREVPGCPCL